MTDSLAELWRFSPSLDVPLLGAERAAASDAPILILGEPGTGRSTLARILHRASARRGRALVEIDPGQLQPTLFESELFGYEKGAFTGAESSEAGRVAQAAGGTLVLDHVEELPLTVQPKLLRLLAEHRYAPLGGRERDLDVRFIAIGPEDLAERVRHGAFRPDLFYRLEVLAFRLPPLRDRLADLPAICDHLLAELTQRFDRSARLDAAACAWMQDYGWPGNIRQVRNTLERALILAEDGDLRPAPPADSGTLRPRLLRDVERDEIVRALAYSRGHQGRTAELLGISRKALWQKRRRLGLP